MHCVEKSVTFQLADMARQLEAQQSELEELRRRQGAKEQQGNFFNLLDVHTQQSSPHSRDASPSGKSSKDDLISSKYNTKR